MRQALVLILLELAFTVAGYGGKMYSRWRTPMAKYGYSWSAVPAKTEDGYSLLLFRITGRDKNNGGTQYKGRRPPVLMVPGLFDDAARWLQMQSSENIEDEPLPLMLQLAEAGFDVWVGNVRGTEYATDHKMFSAYSPEYWNFNWDKQHARHDVPTLVRRVKEMSGMRKIFYIGYSQGSGSMITALTDGNINSDLKNYLHKAVLLAPCVRFQIEGLDESYFEQGLYKFPQAGIHSLFGPEWDKDLKRICETFSQEVCDEYTQLSQADAESPAPPAATST